MPGSYFSLRQTSRVSASHSTAELVADTLKASASRQPLSTPLRGKIQCSGKAPTSEPDWHFTRWRMRSQIENERRHPNVSGLPVNCGRVKLGHDITSRAEYFLDRVYCRERHGSSCGFRFRSTRAKGGCRGRRIIAGNRSRPGGPGADFGVYSRLEHRCRHLAGTDRSFCLNL